jgi:hypothetical protein
MEHRRPAGQGCEVATCQASQQETGDPDVGDHQQGRDWRWNRVVDIWQRHKGTSIWLASPMSRNIDWAGLMNSPWGASRYCEPTGRTRVYLRWQVSVHSDTQVLQPAVRQVQLSCMVN